MTLKPPAVHHYDWHDAPETKCDSSLIIQICDIIKFVIEFLSLFLREHISRIFVSKCEFDMAAWGEKAGKWRGILLTWRLVGGGGGVNQN